MGGATSLPVFPESVPGKTRICVIGFKISHHTGKAAWLARQLATLYPEKYDTFFWFGSSAAYRGPAGVLPTLQNELPEDHPLRTHRTSPFVWLETPEAVEGKTHVLASRPGVNIWPLGGRDRFSEWILENVAEDDKNLKVREEAGKGPTLGYVWVDETPGTSQPNSHNKK